MKEKKAAKKEVRNTGSHFRVTVQTQVFSEPKIPYEKVVVTDFCHLECEAWQKSVTVHTMCVQ